MIGRIALIAAAWTACSIPFAMLVGRVLRRVAPTLHEDNPFVTDDLDDCCEGVCADCLPPDEWAAFEDDLKEVS